jgi:hypothetical protein
MICLCANTKFPYKLQVLGVLYMLDWKISYQGLSYDIHECDNAIFRILGKFIL